MDIDHIKTLVELMVSNDLHRIEWHDGDKKVLLRRGGPVAAPVIMASSPPAVPIQTAAHSSVPATAPTLAAGHDSPQVTHSDEIIVRSPMVGTFYSSSEPDAPPFVSVGSAVGPDTVVCLIEAMKVFNEIKAEVSGRISRILVKNAQAVEFDQPLFAVTPV